MKNKIVKIVSFLFLIFILLTNRSWTFIGNIKGTYVLHNDENCHLLGHESDMLILHENYTLTSNNFSGNPHYAIEGNFLDKHIRITHDNNKSSTSFIIERTLFGKFKIRTCMDLDEYYYKID